MEIRPHALIFLVIFSEYTIVCHVQVRIQHMYCIIYRVNVNVNCLYKLNKFLLEVLFNLEDFFHYARWC